MNLEWIPDEFTVCQLASPQQADWSAAYTFLCRAGEELSLVCPTSHTPPQTLRRENGWRMFAVEGPLDLNLTGILAKIAACLARAKIPIFAVSTYRTDYILVRSEQQARACAALEEAGYLWSPDRR